MSTATRAERRRASAARTSWREPLAWWVAVAAFDSLTALLHGVTTAGDALRWWFTTDDQIPEMTARWFLAGMHGDLLPGWQATDRGPLQPILLLWGGHWSTNPVPAYFTGVLVNAAWVLGLWWFLRAVRIEERRIRWTVVLVALTGSIWLNTVYPWPKLLAGALALGCAAAVLERRPALAGALGALAVLAHGGALFALVGLIPWVVTRLGKRGLLALLVCGAVYAPWVVFTQTVAPPGDRLLKWHFAGTDISSFDHRSAADAIVSEYEKAGLGVVGNKVTNLRFALGDPTLDDSQGAITKWQHDGFLGELRSDQVTRIIWAPGILLLGLCFGWKRVPRTVWAMLAAWLAAYVLLEWGGNHDSLTWLHTAPMCLVIGWVAACALASPRWMLPLQVAFFVGVWFLAPVVF
jgi:hypothetical protein